MTVSLFSASGCYWDRDPETQRKAKATDIALAFWFRVRRVSKLERWVGKRRSRYQNVPKVICWIYRSFFGVVIKIGCHLVTNEVLSNIGQGLQGVEVCWTRLSQSIHV